MASVKLIKFLDKYFGSLTCLILSINKLFPKKNVKPKKILLIQLWGLGETILTLPTIKELRNKFKNSVIDILTTKRTEQLFYKNKYLNNVKVVNLNPLSIKLFILKNLRKYDLVVDMEEYLNISAIIAFYTGKQRIGYSHGLRSLLYTRKITYNDKQHVSQTFADLLKPLNIKTKINNLESLKYSYNDKKNIEGVLKNFKIKKNDFLVGLGVGAAESARTRMWPEDRFATIAQHLIKKYNAKVFFIGNKNERNLIKNIQNLMNDENNSFNVAGKTTVREMFYLVSLCKLFIGNDSGPMHVAAAQKVPSIGLFGCNLPVRFKPLGENSHYLYKKNNQKACINVHKGEVGECKFGKGNACVKKIKVDDVVKLIDKVLKKK